jgi:hypothetical protein
MMYSDDGDINIEPHKPIARRERKLTVKGLEYTLQTKRTRLEQLSRGLEKNSTVLLDLIDLNVDNITEVTSTYKTWVSLYDQFLEVNTQYTELLSTDELDEYDANWFMHAT